LRVGGRSDLLGRLLSASARRSVLESFGRGVPTTGRPDFRVNLEAVGAGSLAFCLGNHLAFFISQLIVLSLYWTSVFMQVIPVRMVGTTLRGFGSSARSPCS
jgi:hypothetical protein